MTQISFTIPGPPRTKKNHGRIVRCGKFTKMLPSKAFEGWNKSAQVSIREAVLASTREMFPLTALDYLPFAEPVNCRALFYRHANVGDAVGFYQALADALEEAQVVSNDKWIVSWDGSKLLKDAANPRIEVTLSRHDKNVRAAA